MTADTVRRQQNAVFESLHSRWPEVRVAAVEAVTRGEIGASVLRRAAAMERNDVVLATICEALMIQDDRSSVPFLKKVTVTHRSSLVRRHAAWAVSEIVGPSSVEWLRRVVHHERSGIAKAAMLGALVKHGHTESLPALLAMLRSADYRVRTSVANFFADNLGFAADKRVRECLRDAFSAEKTRAASASLKRALRRQSRGGAIH